MTRCSGIAWRRREWLPRLAVRGVAIGDRKVDIAVVRHRDRTVIESVHAQGIDVVRDEIEAPLWGLPSTM